MESPKLKGLGISLGIIIVILAVVSLLGYNSPLQAHVRKGNKAKVQGNFELALKEYELALKANPENMDIELKYAEAKLLLEKYDEANSLLEELLKKDASKKKEIYSLLAKTKLALARQEQTKRGLGSPAAIDYLQEARKYDPGNEEIKLALGEELFLYASYGMPPLAEAAIAKMKEAIELNPNPLFKVELAKRYLIQKSRQEFTGVLDSLTREEIEEPEVTGALAQMFLEVVRGTDPAQSAVKLNPAQAQEVLAEGLQVLPGHPALLLEELRLQVSKGEWQAAEAMLEDSSASAWTKQLLANYLKEVRGNSHVKAKKVIPVNISAQFFNLKPFETEEGTVLAWNETSVPGETSIMELNLATGKQRELLKEHGYINVFALNKGHKLIYWLEIPEYGRVVLKTCDSSGAKTELESWKLGELSFPFISPNQRFAVYLKDSDLVLADLETREKKIAATGVNRDDYIVWSPDSSKFLVRINPKEPKDSPEMLIINSRGEVQERFQAKLGYHYLGWNQAGKLVALHSSVSKISYRAFGIYSAQIDEESMEEKPLMDDNVFQLFGNNFWPFMTSEGRYTILQGLGYQEANNSEFWLLPQGEDPPFVIIGQGALLGWSGTDKLIFSQTGGTGTDPRDVQEQKINKITILTVGE